jgi:two-component system OmpR family response regulator
MNAPAIMGLEARELQAAQPHILAVDDDPAMRKLVADYLAENEVRVTTALDGRSMTEVLKRETVDLVLLDLRLQSENGMDLMCELRAASSMIPVIILTGRRDEADRIMGLELGADDYLTKPFNPRELLARVRTVLRRRNAEVRQGRPQGVRAYRFDGWELNLGTRRLVAPDGRLVPLGSGEFHLLVALLGAPQRVLSRDQLLDLSRLHSDDVFNRSVDIQILRLRRKIEPDPAAPRYIRTKRGEGYAFSVPVEVVYSI